MLTQRWPEIAALFEDALSLTGDEQEQFLRKRCGQDRELYAAVVELLGADKRAASYFDASEDGVDLELLNPLGLPLPDMIGPYRVVDVLGRGGMGIVYRAERVRDFGRVVAVKTIAGFAPSSAVVSRFKREREILSRLEHPGIARLYDGGVDGEAGLFLAMEYIEGLPIDEFCRRENLDGRDILQLFLHVCDAVSFAHRNLVVHRDLKPSNILVDTSGQPKLLDFGIAKWIDAELASGRTDSLYTAMTPAYASPEQLRREPVTTLTDVYSLGVVLHELLTGMRPADNTSPRNSDVVIPIPAHVTSTESSPSLGLPRLNGDIDRMLMKALAADQNERYDSVDNLATDIRLHLQGRPIQARSRRSTYVLKKFVKRNRTALTAGAVACLILLLSVTMLFDSRARLHDQQVLAEGLTSYLSKLFQVVDPDLRQDTVITYEDVLDVAWEQAGYKLSPKGAVFSDLAAQIGRLYTKIGRFEIAAQIHADALVADPTEMSRGQIENLYGLGLAQFELGKFDASLSHLEEALAKETMRTGGISQLTADILVSLSLLQRERGLLTKADSLASAALAMRTEHFASNSRAIAEVLMQLGTVRRLQQDLQGAEMLYMQALDIVHKYPEKPQFIEADILNRLGIVWLKKGRYQTAGTLLERALQMQRSRLGDQHPEVATVMLNLALAVEHTVGPDSSEKLTRAALQNFRSKRGYLHPDVATALNNLGLSRRVQGDFAVAESLYNQALDVASVALPPTHPEIPAIWHNLAVLLRELERYDEANSAYERAASLYKKTASGGQLRLSSALNGLGRVQHQLGNYDEALRSFRESLEIRERTLDPGHWRLGTAHSYYGQMLGLTGGSRSEARHHLEEGLRILVASRGADDSKSVAARDRLRRFRSSSVDQGDKHLLATAGKRQPSDN
jgi:serine/threonine-protein kinase